MAPAAIGACCPKKRGAFSHGDGGFVTRPPEVDYVDGGLFTRPPEVDSPEGFVYHLGKEQFEWKRRITRATRTTNLTIRRIYDTSGSNWCSLYKFRGNDDAIITRSEAGERRASGQPTSERCNLTRGLVYRGARVEFLDLGDLLTS